MLAVWENVLFFEPPTGVREYTHTQKHTSARTHNSFTRLKWVCTYYRCRKRGSFTLGLKCTITGTNTYNHLCSPDR